MIESLPFTLPALRAAYAEGLGPTRVVAEAYRRVAAAADPGIFLHLVPEAAAMEAAEAIGSWDPSLPLWGVPFAIKDNIDLAGAPTTTACPAFAYVPIDDAFVVARLRSAGAVALGKTNLDQFATGLVGMRTPYPAPRNALDAEIVPGGSSSGSAVAVALGLVAFALGTDTAGSGRVPAAFNGIVGLKPSLGALSTAGVVPACRTLDAVSVFALTVDDAHAVFRVAAGHDPDDPYSRPVPAEPLGPPPPHPRVGVPSWSSRRFYGDRLQAVAFDEATAQLERMGARLVEVDFAPYFAVADLLYDGPWLAERLAVIEPLLARDPEAVLPVIRRIVEPARDLDAVDAFRGLYRLEALRREVDQAMRGVDLLCVPSIPTFYSVADLQTDHIGPNRRLGTYTNFVNLIGLCGITVPAPGREDGRPGSVTFLAAHGLDALVAAMGRRLEAEARPTLGATGWPRLPLAALPARAREHEIELAVCGAHMSGMPLNGELIANGGRFLRETTTTDAYRLFSLAGGPPSRPGLLRGLPGSGGPIAVEVWALAKAKLGDFIAGVPAPLGIGTVLLADGTSPKGFLCEAAGVAGASDVTAIGDWRRFAAGGMVPPARSRPKLEASG